MAGGWLATDKTNLSPESACTQTSSQAPRREQISYPLSGMEFARAASSHSFEPGFELKPGEVDTGVSAPARSRALARSRAAP